MHKLEEERSVCWDVIEAVADAKGCDPADLTPRLGEVIDCDALNQLCANTNSRTLELQFQYSGCEVVIHGDGTVDVQKR